MALNFPDSPTNGQKYTDATTGETWTYEASTNSWTSDGLTTAVGVQYKGGINITTAPPAGVKGGWQYTVTTGGTANAGFTGLSGNVPAGTTIIYDGANWQQAGAGVLWVRTGTELAPSNAGDSVFTSGAVKVGGTTAAPNLQIKADGGIVANTDGLVYNAAQKRLGLGDSAPSARLVCNGAIQVTNTGTPTTGAGLEISYGQINASRTSMQSYNRTGSAYLGADYDALDHRFYTSGTTRMTLTSTGLGIGTTGPAQALDVKGIIQTIGANGWTANGDTAWVYFGDSNNRVGGTRGGTIGFYSDYAPLELGAGGGVGSSAGTQLITFKTGTSERARIDSSGRLLVGTSTAGAGTSGITVQGSPGLFTLQRDATPSGAGTSLGTINFSNTAPGTGAQISCESDAAWGSNDYPGRLVFSTTADGASSPTERMRIDSAGLVTAGSGAANGMQALLLNSGQINTSGGLFTLRTVNDNSGGYYQAFRNAANTVIGTISQSGTTAVSYNTTSDYRLKENVVPLTGAADRLNQLQVRRFNFIADPDRTVDGFIAHEAQAVVPECVTGEKDAVDDDGNPVYQGIDQSKLVPLLTAALQEALQKIEDLEGRLTAAGI
jgi:hypothetical protein